ncbi:hypothetical protein TRFO_10020 [Tritrichomonas foetus]|uniref:Uncharacterized protein n=1 Tax=Tritrichomonas foetus TaxID=1144522 RepID=A0A1J4JB26_9EUKA|nr:hypothetical protein TRFO_10020 [Tritrichomonas foetus]|eukprot:OHS96360.1 hypothetical protein TRFO_10020 [Tritrichomonas foetus]
MNFKRPSFSNDLSNLIKKTPNITLEQVLEHPSLSQSIRNEDPELFNFLFPEDQMDLDHPQIPNFDRLIDYALTDINSHPNQYLIYQLNRNAANFLSTSNKKLMTLCTRDKTKRLFRRLRGFIYDSDERILNNPMFVGHFSRIFPMWLVRYKDEFTEKNSFYNDRFSIIHLIEHSIANMPNNKAYSQIITALIQDCFNYIDGEKVISYILCAMKTILPLPDDSDEGFLKIEEFPSVSQIYKNSNSQNYLSSSQNSLNYQFEPISVPNYCQINHVPDIEVDFSKLTDLSHDRKLEKKLQSYSDDDKYWIVYNLISILRNSCDNENICNIFRKVEKDQEIPLDFLLYIAVYGLYSLSVSSEAFKIIDLVLNDPNATIDQELMKKVDEYASLIKFDTLNSNNLPMMVVYSLPVFWNHKYENIQVNKDSQISISRARFNKLAREQLKDKVITNKNGLTLLQLLTPLVLTDPPLSTELNCNYLRVLKKFDERYKKLKNDFYDLEKQKKPANSQKMNDLALEIHEVDRIYLDLVYYKFNYPNPDSPRKNIFEVLLTLFPMNPKLYGTGNREKLERENKEKLNQALKNSQPRSYTNGIVYELANLFNYSCFLTGDNETKFPRIELPQSNYNPEATICDDISIIYKQSKSNRIKTSIKKSVIGGTINGE